jgi:hypothetical protein
MASVGMEGVRMWWEGMEGVRQEEERVVIRGKKREKREKTVV